MKLLIDFIIISGIIITILVLFLLIKPKEKELSKKLLITFYCILLSYLVHHYASIHEIPLLFFGSFIFDAALPLIWGPVIFLYIKSLFVDNSNLIKKNWLHFIPTILFSLFISIPYLISLGIGRPLFNYLEFIDTHYYTIFVYLGFILLFYNLISLRLFFKYRKAMKLNFASLSEEDFGWVKHMLIGVVFIIFINISLDLYNMYIETIDWNFAYITNISMFILICYLGYYGVNQSKILLPDFLIKDSILNDDKNDKINHLSNVSNEELQELKSRLEIVLTDEKPYLDEDLTLNKLAQLIPTTDKKLSTFLNHHLNTTFYDIINEYRVESVKEKLNSDNYDKITLLGIAYESGFKSKTSFNRIFKRKTGLSPSEYKNNSC